MGKLFFEVSQDQGDDPAALHVNGNVASPFVKALECLSDSRHGHALVFHYEGNKDGQDFSRTCAMRVDNIGEVMGVLEIFFKD